MIDYTDNPNFADRSMITGFVVTDDAITEVQGFYCTNGEADDGQWNVRDAEGRVAPGPASTSPMYFFPEVGYSMGLESVHAERKDAARELRDRAQRMVDYYQDILDSI